MDATQKSESPGGAGQFAAKQNVDNKILAQILPDAKSQCTVQAEFARRGHELTVSHRADDGRTTWHVGRWGQSRHFTHWHDVIAFLAQIGGGS